MSERRPVLTHTRIDWNHADFLPTLAASQEEDTSMEPGPEPFAMFDYCRDRVTCRHILLKRYFDSDSLSSPMPEAPASSQETLWDNFPALEHCCDNCTGVHWAYTERLDETSSARRILSLLDKVRMSTRQNITSPQLAALYSGMEVADAWGRLAEESALRMCTKQGAGHTVIEARQIVDELISQCILKVVKSPIIKDGREYYVFYLRVSPWTMSYCCR